MGKEKKKGYNWKARTVVNTVIDNSKTDQIKLDLSSIPQGTYDDCNALVLPSKKRKTEKKKENVTVTKILSKRHRKILEKVVEKKVKKENRANLLEALTQVQAPLDLYKHLTSISAMQTKGLKRHFREMAKGERVVQPESESEDEAITKINSVAGSRKRKRLLALAPAASEEAPAVKDINVIGLESSSESDSDESDTESVKEEKDESDVKTELMETADDSVAEQNGNIETISVDETEPASNSTEEESNKSTSNKEEDKSTAAETTPTPTVVVSKPAVFVPVNRDPEIQAARMKLPILAEEQVVMETITENDVTIIAGETGSGKTTQVPQFLYEAGYASNGMLIGVTEPRRVAAISMASRVGHEMNLSNREVSYLIRFEGNVTDDTKIKFMTDGVLLKEIQTDFLLSRYSVVLLDEAHERSVYTDILIGLLSRIVPLRKKRGNPLKLVIMSATLRLEDFTENRRLFKTPPPVIKVESRQFPVTIHFNKRTTAEYVDEAFKKACKIHSQLPSGGILIFVTGQQEVNYLVKKLRRYFPFHNKKYEDHEEGTEEALSETLKTGKLSRRQRKEMEKKVVEVKLPEINLDDYSAVPNDDTEFDMLGGEEGELSEEDDDTAISSMKSREPMWVLPLYSLLPSKSQAKVFEPPPTGCRFCVVSTNVAETSLTIPGIKYVVDSGRVKTRLYDKVTGVTAFDITWSSKAGANQRAGRAGRTSAGHCYRLFSSAIFNDEFEEFSKPEIQRKPVDDLLLQMKVMNIVKVVNFPFPSPPDHLQLKTAEKRLRLLGALTAPPKGEDEWSSRISPLGIAISAFPVAPRFGKMLALSYQHDLLPYTICMVAALSVQEVLHEVPVISVDDDEEPKQNRNEWALTRRNWAGTGQSLLLGDPMVLLRAVGAAEYAGVAGKLEEFCETNGLRYKAITEVRKLRQQLTTEINLNLPELNLFVDPKLKPPTESQARQLRQILLAGLTDQVALRVCEDEIKVAEDRAKWKYAYRCGEMEEPVFLHSSSVLRKERPHWVVYQEVYETTKLLMRGVTAIEPQWLPTFAPDMCQLSEPLPQPEPRYDAVKGKVFCHVTGTYGIAAWPIPIVEVEYPPGLDRYKWFAKFLLEGTVFPLLAQFVPVLLTTPSTMTKSWAKLQPRTTSLLNALISVKADSKEALLEAWETDASCVLAAYQEWLPESAHNDAALLWPPRLLQSS